MKQSKRNKFESIEQDIINWQNQGKRINHPYLGDGTIQEKKYFAGITGYKVLFDKTPDERYNLGQNPTLVFANEITFLKGKRTGMRKANRVKQQADEHKLLSLSANTSQDSSSKSKGTEKGSPMEEPMSVSKLRRGEHLVIQLSKQKSKDASSSAYFENTRWQIRHGFALVFFYLISNFDTWWQLTLSVITIGGNLIMFVYFSYRKVK